MIARQPDNLFEDTDMSRPEPLVHVALVNWNDGQHVLACLGSLSAVSYTNYRIVIVDNASSDGSADIIASAYPNMTLLRLAENHGFTGANNVAFRHALELGTDFVYLLNGDTRVAPDFLSQAVSTALADPSIGIVGSKVLHADRPDRLQFAGAHVNLMTGHSGRPYSYGEMDDGQCDHITDVDRVTGCAMMVSRRCLEATGGFDDAFFAFHEDVDLCLTARAAGFRVVMSPRSRVWHEGGGSIGGAASPTHMYYSVRNGLRLVQKHKPARNRALGLLRAGCIVGAHLLQVILGGRTIAEARAIAHGTWDYYRGVTHAWPSS
jgi:GT2 family glycosyltransferase